MGPAIENVFGKNLAHLMAIRNFESVLGSLIGAEQVEINAADKEGLKPIHNAALHGSVAALKILAKKETDFRFCSDKYGTIFHMCANSNPKVEIEMIQILIDELMNRKENIKQILDISNSRGGYALNYLSEQSFLKLQNATLEQT